MNQVILKTVAVLGLMSVAACGGGSGGSAPTQPPVTPDTGPASTSSADLLDYVLDGGSEVYNYEADRNNITRLQRSTTVNGETVVVTVDQLAGGSNGHIMYKKGDDMMVYALDDSQVASTNTPDGQFNGTFDVSYSVDGGATWVDGTGDASAVINTGTGTADFGGMASNTSTSGDVTSVEFYSTSNLVDGQFNDNAADVIYREGGLTAGQYDGEVNGMVLDDGVVGLVGSNSGDFVATGGFTLSPNASN
ncbi:hypothetical protein KUV57_13225 [Epibacterium sp. DP7N7-1]|nr:hypothetical protein [Epibacterium sp. DP7N7-1]